MGPVHALGHAAYSGEGGPFMSASSHGAVFFVLRTPLVPAEPEGEGRALGEGLGREGPGPAEGAGRGSTAAILHEALWLGSRAATGS